MKKIIAFLAVVVLFWMGVNAQTAQENLPFYLPSVPQEEFEMNPLLSTTFYGECACWDFEPTHTEWRELYCESGALVRERTVYGLATPYCVDRAVYTEQDLFFDRRCKICPDPLFKGNWTDVAFINGKWLQQRQVSAYKFNQTVTECVQVESAELRWSEQSVGGGAASSALQLVPIALVLVVFFVVLKKVKK